MVFRPDSAIALRNDQVDLQLPAELFNLSVNNKRTLDGNGEFSHIFYEGKEYVATKSTALFSNKGLPSASSQA